jgi:hypothetical protein
MDAEILKVLTDLEEKFGKTYGILLKLTRRVELLEKNEKKR